MGHEDSGFGLPVAQGPGVEDEQRAIAVDVAHPVAVAIERVVDRLPDEHRRRPRSAHGRCKEVRRSEIAACVRTPKQGAGPPCPAPRSPRQWSCRNTRARSAAPPRRPSGAEGSRRPLRRSAPGTGTALRNPSIPRQSSRRQRGWSRAWPSAKSRSLPWVAAEGVAGSERATPPSASTTPMQAGRKRRSFAQSFARAKIDDEPNSRAFWPHGAEVGLLRDHDALPILLADVANPSRGDSRRPRAFVSRPPA